MKLIHLSDLHLGKRVREFSLLEDQRDILQKILAITEEERPDAVLLSGDIYDKSVPSAEAVDLFDSFLTALAGRCRAVLVISGNHDSPERIAFAGRLVSPSGVYLSPVYSGRVEPVVLKDAFGPVSFYLLPFVKPVHVRRAFPDETINSYTDALSVAVAHMQVDPAGRNVLLTHQYVAGAQRCDSEELAVGGSDAVDVSVFDCFDYVALGHLHGPQYVGRKTVRYCGTPLKYSFSEVHHHKSVTVVELGRKGEVAVRTRPLQPLRDFVALRGSYLEVTARSFYQKLCREDYFRITLTDEQDIPDAVGKLRSIYPNLMALDYDNARTRAGLTALSPSGHRQETPIELFSALYQAQNGGPMSEEQTAYMTALFAEIWEEEL